MIFLNGSRNYLQVYIWDNSDLNFMPSPLSLSVDGTVQSIIPGDINYDGALDILITYSNSEGTYTQVVLQQGDIFSPQTAMEIPPLSQPVMLDINADYLMEVLVNEDNEVAVYSYSNGSLTKINQLGDFASSFNACLSYETILFSTPHSIGFVDLNKDCLADLFLTVDRDGALYFEVWLSMTNGVYCRAQSSAAPAGTQQVSFEDLDRNGIEDIVIPVCEGPNCSIKQEIHIVFNYNEQSSDCSYSPVSSADFSLADLSSPNSTDYKYVIPIDSQTLYSPDSAFPITLRFGDFNLDGYPDALITLYNLTEGSTSAHVEFFENLRCDECGKGGRTLSKSEDSDMDKLRRVTGVILSCFFDLDDNGVLDIILVSYNGTQYLISSFYNNYLNDAFHLKALALDGYGKGVYSSAFPGAVFMFTLTELDMSKVIMHSTQMPLTGYFALNTPYCVYGLGRTNSYIEEFYVAMPINDTYHRSWTPIIPNSYLIASTGKKVDDWYLELFASPTDKIGIIIGVCLGCMTIIGIVVVYNYCREKREDRILFGIRF